MKLSLLVLGYSPLEVRQQHHLWEGTGDCISGVGVITVSFLKNLEGSRNATTTN